MNLSATLQALTPREKLSLGVLGIVLLIAGGVYVYPLLVYEKTADAPITAPPAAVQPKRANVPEAPVQPYIPVVNMKNPFLVPPQYQVRKEAAAPAASANNPPASGQASAQKPVNIGPVLTGIATSGTMKKAILELDGNSDTYGVGDAIGGYTVTWITDTQVVLNGPAGRQVLNIGR